MEKIQRQISNILKTTILYNQRHEKNIENIDIILAGKKIENGRIQSTERERERERPRHGENWA